MDKNLWATAVYSDWDTLSQDNMWNMYQWWNNYWFPSTWTISNTSSTQVDASSYWPGNYYSSDTFITWSDDWSSVSNNDLWWDTTWTITQENVISNIGVLSVNGQTWDVTIVSPDMSNYLAKDNTTSFTPTWDYQPATKKYVDDHAGGEQNLFIITEDMVTVSTSEDMWVAPYSTSYKYTNFDIDANAGIEWKEWAIYTFVVDTEMAVASAYRNVRVRIGNWAYIPVMWTTAAIAGNSYFAKTAIRQFQYTTKYESGWGLHVFTDSNTTYKAMTEAQATDWTATTALTITPAVLKWAITTHAPVKSVNWSTWAVTWLQTTANLKTNLTDNSDSYYPSQKAVKTAVDAKQATLVSWTNIKTINNTSVLWSWNIAVQDTISDLSTIRTNATNWATVVSWNSWENYVIKVSTTAPTSWTANNVITIVTN